MAMTRTELSDYVKRKLGHPIVKVELDDRQIDDNINDAIIMYRDWSSDGAYSSVMALNGIRLQANYVLTADIIQVKEALTASFSRALTTNIVDPYLNIFGPANQGYGLVEIGTEYLSDVQRMYETKLGFTTFMDVNGLLNIEFTPPPKVDEMIGLIVEKRIDEKVLLDSIWVKQYVTALSKVSLGEVREKYNQLAGPNGPQLNGAALKSEGIQEIKDQLEILKKRHFKPIGWIVG